MVVVVVVPPLSRRRRDDVRVLIFFMVVRSDTLSQNRGDEDVPRGGVGVGVGEYKYLVSMMGEKERKISSQAQSVGKKRMLKRIYAVLFGAVL